MTEPKVMQFIPQLAAFLCSHKFIYTVRKYRMYDAVVAVTGLNGKYYREYIGEVLDDEDLRPLTPYSGFQNLEEWLEMINRFIPNKREKRYLYRVTAR